MLDFDFICKRKTPSVAGIIYTFGGQFVSKMCVSLTPDKMLSHTSTCIGNTS